MRELVAEAATSAPPPAPARVCLVVDRLGPDDAERQLVLLAIGLARYGVAVSVVSLALVHPGEPDLAGTGIEVVHLGGRRARGWRRLPARLAVAARLAAYLRRSRPDVVHTFRFPAFALAAPLARLARVPVVVAGQASPDAGQAGRAGRGVRRRLLRVAERLALRCADRIVAHAQAGADRVRDDELVPAGKLAVIYHGVPAAVFATAEPAPLVSPYPVVLCVGRLEWRRGRGHLLEAVALLRARGLTCTLMLTDRNAPEPAWPRRRAAELGVDLRETPPGTDGRHLLARADAVVLPDWSEGLGDAVLEALAAGRPVIGAEAGDLPELLGGGRGVLVPPGDPGELADALAGVLTDPRRAEQMGRTARDWSRTHLHADAAVRRHLTLYNELGDVPREQSF